MYNIATLKKIREEATKRGIFTFWNTKTRQEARTIVWVRRCSSPWPQELVLYRQWIWGFWPRGRGENRRWGCISKVPEGLLFKFITQFSAAFQPLPSAGLHDRCSSKKGDRSKSKNLQRPILRGTSTKQPILTDWSPWNTQVGKPWRDTSL